jgi:hypothetical protein
MLVFKAVIKGRTAVRSSTSSQHSESADDSDADVSSTSMKQHEIEFSVVPSDPVEMKVTVVKDSEGSDAILAGEKFTIDIALIDDNDNVVNPSLSKKGVKPVFTLGEHACTHDAKVHITFFPPPAPLLPISSFFSLFIFHLIERSFSLKTEKVTALADTIRVVLRAVPVDSSDTQVCTLCFLIMSCSLASSMRASISRPFLYVLILLSV